MKINGLGRINLLLFIGLNAICFEGFSQQKLEITFCDGMKDMGKLKMMTIIDLSDTLKFPSLGSDLFLNGFNLCDEPMNYNRKDITKVRVAFESDDFKYSFEILKKDLFCPKLDFCIDKIRRGEYRYTYLNCASVAYSGSAVRVKK